MLMEVGFPSYFGYNAPQNNAADMNTKGWDLELSWSDQINDFRYGASFNISDYRSKWVIWPTAKNRWNQDYRRGFIL